jgi:hypothetical protein
MTGDWARRNTSKQNWRRLNAICWPGKLEDAEPKAAAQTGGGKTKHRRWCTGRETGASRTKKIVAGNTACLAATWDFGTVKTAAPARIDEQKLLHELETRAARKSASSGSGKQDRQNQQREQRLESAEKRADRKNFKQRPRNLATRNEIWISGAELSVTRSGSQELNSQSQGLIRRTKTGSFCWTKSRPKKIDLYRDGLGALQLAAVDAKTGTKERRKSVDEEYLRVLKLRTETN